MRAVIGLGASVTFASYDRRMNVVAQAMVISVFEFECA